MWILTFHHIIDYEPRHEKTNSRVSKQGQHKPSFTNTEDGNLRFRNKRNCTIRVAKTKVLDRFAVTAKLICAFVFVYVKCLFSYAAACNYVNCRFEHILLISYKENSNISAW